MRADPDDPWDEDNRTAVWNGAMGGYKRHLYPPHHFAEVPLHVQLIQIPLPLWVVVSSLANKKVRLAHF